MTDFVVQEWKDWIRVCNLDVLCICKKKIRQNANYVKVTFVFMYLKLKGLALGYSMGTTRIQIRQVTDVFKPRVWELCYDEFEITI